MVSKVAAPVTRIASTIPKVLQRETTEHSLAVRFSVPSDLLFCEGHFPGHPIVPGFVLIRWGLFWINEQWGRHFQIDAISIIKFKRAVTPGQDYRFYAQWQVEQSALRFSFRDMQDQELATALVTALNRDNFNWA